MNKIVYICALILFIPALASAELTYEGSSTIGEIIMPGVSAAFEKKTGIKFSKIGIAGSGSGIKAVQENKTDIGGISRSLTRNEMNMRHYYCIAGYDAIVVFVNKNNPVNNLSAAAVKGIFSGRIKNWRELGGANAPIVVVTEIMAGKRATMEEFRHLAMDGSDYIVTKEIDKPADCVKHVATDINAVTFAGMAFRVDGIKAVIYDNTDPSRNNVSTGAYPLSRPLIFMTKKYPRGDIKKFFDFLLSSEGQKIIGEKIVPIKQAD